MDLWSSLKKKKQERLFQMVTSRGIPSKHGTHVGLGKGMQGDYNSILLVNTLMSEILNHKNAVLNI